MKKTLVSALITIPLLILFLAFCLGCRHEQTTAVLLRDASCLEAGEAAIHCSQCDALLGTEAIAPAGHSYGNWTLTELPSLNKDGLEVRSCSLCGAEEEQSYVCPHAAVTISVTLEATCVTEGHRDTLCKLCGTVLHRELIEPLPHKESYLTTLQEASCGAEGLEALICQECDVTVEEFPLDRLACTYGDWSYTKFATPFEEGELSRQCAVCGQLDTKAYTMTMPGENSIYIPGTDVVGQINIASFTQSSVDRYDMILCESSPDFEGITAEDPIVLGHNYGTLGDLYHVTVGQKIYLSVRGQLRVYEVVDSEYAEESCDHTDVVGQDSHLSVFDHSGHMSAFDHSSKEALHLYTCYKRKDNSYRSAGRWMVLAVRVDQTPEKGDTL